MKTFLIPIFWASFLVHVCIADGTVTNMDISSINELVKQMDNSCAKGTIYHINYSIKERMTDYYYAFNQEMVNYLNDHHDELLKSFIANPENASLADPEKRCLDFINIFQKKLKAAREHDTETDYSLDGVGFYVKQAHSFIKKDGGVVKPHTTIYVSDGKIMGTFYVDSSQAVIQPATERPRMPSDPWANMAYLNVRQT